MRNAITARYACSDPAGTPIYTTQRVGLSIISSLSHAGKVYLCLREHGQSGVPCHNGSY